MRTDLERVQGIIETDPNIIIGDDEMEPFIVAASQLVDEVCDIEANGYADQRLELIERWLSAHFYTVRDPRVKMEKAGEVSATYESNTGLNLASSRYGQMAMLLDTKGGLAALNQRAIKGAVYSYGVTYLGTAPE